MTEELEGLNKARNQFTEAGLPLPPIPEQFANEIVEVREWTYGTREEGPSIYEIRDYVSEFLDAPPEPYLLFGHAGHGLNSYAIHYHLVVDGLGVFCQIGWGGVYMDHNSATQNVKLTFRLLEQLAEHLDSLRPSSPSRTLLVLTNFRGSELSLLGPESHRQVIFKQKNLEKAVQEAAKFLYGKVS